MRELRWRFSFFLGVRVRVNLIPLAVVEKGKMGVAIYARVSTANNG